MEISDRIKMIIKMHNLTASAFADKIQVQRSSISHVMSGRNKPSVDFIEKILTNFPRVNAQWLITGQTSTNQSANNVKEESEPEYKLVQHKTTIEKEKTEKSKIAQSTEIERIVVFYSNGKFKEYIP